MSRMKTVLTIVCMLILVRGGHAQQQETVNPDAIFPDDSAELENRIRHKKFDRILPRVMQDNNIDMWIHIMRPWTKDQPGITAPLIGPRTPAQLEPLSPILDVHLDDETRKACDQLVPPGSVVANFHNTADWMKAQVV